MPDGIPSIKSRYPVAVMWQPTLFLVVKIDNKIQGRKSNGFYLSPQLKN